MVAWVSLAKKWRKFISHLVLRGGTRGQFEEPGKGAEGVFVPTVIMEKVSRKLELFPDSSMRDLRQSGRARLVDLRNPASRIRRTYSGHQSGLGRATKYEVLGPLSGARKR